jgi:hypothetical protein
MAGIIDEILKSNDPEVTRQIPRNLNVEQGSLPGGLARLK